MTKNEYTKIMIKQLKKMKVKEEVKTEILNDLEDFFVNEPREDLDIIKHFGEPTDFINSYLTDEDLQTGQMHLMTTVKRIFKPLLTVIAGILVLAPVIWFITYIFKLRVEVGYLFQFFVSLAMFGLGFWGLLLFLKKN